MNGNAADGHRARLRERFLQGGLDGFHDYEVIELLLTLGTPRKDCKPSAKAAMARFGTFQAVLEASPEDLNQVPGIGKTNMIALRLIKAVTDRYLQKKLTAKETIRGTTDLLDYLRLHIGEKGREWFLVILLNAKNQVIRTETHSVGSVSASSVYTREVIQLALKHDAAAMILAHNHPSGDPAPSAEDVAVTRRLVFAGKIMGISVHEHLIIGNPDYYSFAENGYVRRFEREYESSSV
ncbi:MAG: hypothetical protein CSA22_08650 [Deltaproteobacteria bacterium]|nr:MAG: hypothetical protein CSA22_08650 [Deltaproteobacteria bacterium]